MVKDYYQILGVAPWDSPDEIKRAFRRLAQRIHPDKSCTVDAPEQFREILQAYDVLKDRKKRLAYDRFLAQDDKRGYTVRHSYSEQDPLLAAWSHSGACYLFCGLGLLLAVLWAVDYFLPLQSLRQTIASRENVGYRIPVAPHTDTLLFNHVELKTEEGDVFSIAYEDAPYFLRTHYVRLYATQIFCNELWIKPENGDHTVKLTLIYGNLAFLPILMFIASALGVTCRKDPEFNLSCSVISVMLFLMVMALLVLY